METVAVCLYSKYSQRCKEFLDDTRPGMLHMLCIDNEEVRQAITKDSHGYHIRTVPCVFVFYPNGRLEKYEGSDAFTWLRKIKDIIETNNRPQSSFVQQQTTSIQQQTPIQKQTPIQQQTAIQQQSPSMEQQPPPLATNEFEQIDPEPLDITPIEENGIQTVHVQQPSQNAEDIINKEMEMRRASDQVITRKQDNIKELAQMMQRQRENDDDKITPPLLYPKDIPGRMY